MTGSISHHISKTQNDESKFSTVTFHLDHRPMFKRAVYHRGKYTLSKYDKDLGKEQNKNMKYNVQFIAEDYKLNQ